MRRMCLIDARVKGGMLMLLTAAQSAGELSIQLKRLLFALSSRRLFGSLCHRAVANNVAFITRRSLHRFRRSPRDIQRTTPPSLAAGRANLTNRRCVVPP